MTLHCIHLADSKATYNKWQFRKSKVCHPTIASNSSICITSGISFHLQYYFRTLTHTYSFYGSRLSALWCGHNSLSHLGVAPRPSDHPLLSAHQLHKPDPQPLPQSNDSNRSHAVSLFFIFRGVNRGWAQRRAGVSSLVVRICHSWHMAVCLYGFFVYHEASQREIRMFNWIWEVCVRWIVP